MNWSGPNAVIVCIPKESKTAYSNIYHLNM